MEKGLRCNHETTVINIYQNWHKDCKFSYLVYGPE